MTWEYVEPATVEEALAALAGEEARVLAGGVSLMVLLRNRLLTPRRLVNLKTVPGLDGIAVGPDGALRVGALATHRALERSPLVRERWALLAQAAGHVGSPPIRNMGTIGGNVCHGDPAADLPAALCALDARLRVVGPGGEREIPAAEFHRGYYETALGPAEILREIVVPPAPPGARGVYLKLRRTATDLAVVGVAAQLEVAHGRCRWARLAVGAAAAVPVRLRDAEACLVGRTPDEAAAREAAALAGRAVDPLDDARGSAWYRRRMVEVMVARAVLAAARREP
ncbi:MAG: xanthine dehydrogenase family protein subunit M [Candidatus Rokubacteria bacterium]|nr:xanthine dehydrogenase family protein subunit M [Candidatus Rokubacteria bacterium]